MSQKKFGLLFVVGFALIAGTLSLGACGSDDKVTKTTTTEQSTGMMPMTPATSSTSTTTTTEQSR